MSALRLNLIHTDDVGAKLEGTLTLYFCKRNLSKTTL